MVGPGAYTPNLESSKRNAAKCRFGSEERGRMKTEGTPGPGTYESKGTNEFPLYGFGSNPRHGIDMPNKSYPGPGTYDENQDAVKNAPPRYGFG